MGHTQGGSERGAAPPLGVAPEFRLVQLTGSFEGFGVTMDYLSRRPPFAGYDLGNFAAALRLQLATGRHVAALEGPRMVGYCGWIATRSQDAQEWMRNRGPLMPAEETADAIGVTTVAADDRRILTALIRHARERNRGASVYFKREYADGRRADRKSSVVNRDKRFP